MIHGLVVFVVLFGSLTAWTGVLVYVADHGGK